MKYIAKINTNFDGSVDILNEYPAKVPQDLFCRGCDSVAHAERLLNERGIPFRVYQHNAETGKRDMVRQSANYPTI